MSKKLTKILITGVLAIMCMGLFAGCGSDIATDKVSVGIKAEFKEKFLAEEFTVEDLIRHTLHSGKKPHYDETKNQETMPNGQAASRKGVTKWQIKTVK